MDATLNEAVLLMDTWAERLAQAHAVELLRMAHGERSAWVRGQVAFLDPTDEEVTEIVMALDKRAPYSPPPADQPRRARSLFK